MEQEHKVTFLDLTDKFKENEITFEELVETSATLTWGTKVIDPLDGSVDWLGDNLLVDVYASTALGVFTVEQRETLLTAIREATT